MKDQDILLIDKEAGWTSFDIVAKIRGMIRAQYVARGEKPTKRQLRVGHTGTLDPFATGLVIVLLGDACSRSDEFLKFDKVYEATIKLGETSTTGDPEGEILPYSTTSAGSKLTQSAENNDALSAESRVSSGPSDVVAPSLKVVQDALHSFVGNITQVPPMHSAIKINGQRAYKLARAGKTVEMPSRSVTIYTLDLVDYTYPLLKIRTHVSSGTYIRTLAEDIGKALGVGGYCLELRRTKVGEYSIDDAKTIQELNIDK